MLAGDAGTNGTIYTGFGEEVKQEQYFGVPAGSELEFYLNPAEGYKVDRVYYKKSTDGGVTYTGEEVDVTKALDNDGFLKLKVDATCKLVVVWESLSGLKKLDNSAIQCFTSGNGIQINGIAVGSIVKVYNIAGVIVSEFVANSNNVTIPLKSGVFVVRLDEGVQKVIVK